MKSIRLGHNRFNSSEPASSLMSAAVGEFGGHVRVGRLTVRFFPRWHWGFRANSFEKSYLLGYIDVAWTRRDRWLWHRRKGPYSEGEWR